MPLIGCDNTVQKTFPAHEISYRPGHLRVEEYSSRVEVHEDIDTNAYPHLSLRGVVLQRAIYRYIAGDAQGFLVALHVDSDRGFAVEPLHGVQGELLFAPIESTDEALEYVKLTASEPRVSYYDSEGILINSQGEFEEALSYLKEETAHYDGVEVEVEVTRTSPTNVTTVTEKDAGICLVELVYRCESYVQWISHLACLVHSDGSLEFQNEYTLIEGSPGPVL